MYFFSEITSQGLYIHNISASTTVLYNSSITQLSLETPVVSASLKCLPSSWSHVGNNVTCSYTDAIDLFNSVSWTVPNNACIQVDVPGVYMYDAAFAVKSNVSLSSSTTATFAISCNTSCNDNTTNSAIVSLSPNQYSYTSLKRYVNKTSNNTETYYPLVQVTENCSLSNIGSFFSCIRLA